MLQIMPLAEFLEVIEEAHGNEFRFVFLNCLVEWLSLPSKPLLDHPVSCSAEQSYFGPVPNQAWVDRSELQPEVLRGRRQQRWVASLAR